MKESRAGYVLGNQEDHDGLFSFLPLNVLTFFRFLTKDEIVADIFLSIFFSFSFPITCSKMAGEERRILKLLGWAGLGLILSQDTAETSKLDDNQ